MNMPSNEFPLSEQPCSSSTQIKKQHFQQQSISFFHASIPQGEHCLDFQQYRLVLLTFKPSI